ncbi:phage tail tube protein [Brevundimonas naejangsanensis]|nr:hypothetical protein [Brevundimonas sp.]
MALVKTTRWSELVLKVGDGATPEQFKPLCTINAARGINFNANTTEDSIPDCDDLQKLQWLIREKVSLSVDVTGAGKVDKKDVKPLVDWQQSPETRNCIVVLDDADPDNVIQFLGAYHLTTFSMNGDPGTPTVTGDIALQSSGAVTATYGANVGGA